MITTGLSYCLMALAFLVSTIAYPYVLAFARKHKVVDNPSARKLQRVPVPVMGGTSVYIGMLVAVVVGLIFVPNVRVVKIMSLLTVMYAIGVWDDVKDVSASLRFLVELLVVWMMILILGVEINDFHGLWGIHEVPDAVSVPLSLVAGVGIMNAVNLIDGVDGYCSTYGAMACAAFAIIFYYCGDMPMFAMALISIGAFIPFFFHNVFGKTSKMFLGDGGSLMLGTLLAFFTFRVLTHGSPEAVYVASGVSLPAVCLAILAVPVFDTLRVMIVRVIKGGSPFHPDKTHLHHLFIDLNFSHLSTAGIIVFGNVVVGVLQFVVWRLGLSVDMQTYIVIVSALLFTWCFYFFMDREHRKNDGDGSKFWQFMCHHNISNLSSTPLWQFIRKVVDSRLLGEGLLKREDISGEDAKVISGQKRPDPRVNVTEK